MKATFHLWRNLFLGLALLLALPSLAFAQVPPSSVDPGYPPLEPGSAFVVNSIMILFTVLILVITFKVPKRNAVDTERD